MPSREEWGERGNGAVIDLHSEETQHGEGVDQTKHEDEEREEPVAHIGEEDEEHDCHQDECAHDEHHPDLTMSFWSSTL